MLLNRLWRLGDIEIPIGKPWFALHWPTFFFRGAPWPICWQGWAAIAGLIVWLIGSFAIFVLLNWQVGNLLFYGWLMPTLAFWAFLVGAKTDMRMTK